ncbi:MAG: hypothetical protein DHS20C11_20060 [Lysobacteraceae bacterium]|nr:MAG: hypothetical protein DHS20C11_20060 [Xanthomonadaceae bacterium]
MFACSGDSDVSQFIPGAWQQSQGVVRLTIDEPDDNGQGRGRYKFEGEDVVRFQWTFDGKLNLRTPRGTAQATVLASEGFLSISQVSDPKLNRLEGIYDPTSVRLY